MLLTYVWTIRYSGLRQDEAVAAVADRIRFIEGLRGLAALYVTLGHFCSMVDPVLFFGGRSVSPAWMRLWMTPFGYGHLAVAAFITISGFCLQLALFKGSSAGKMVPLGKFFKRRAWRILPAYYACLAVSVAVALWITPLGKGMPFTQYLPVTMENTLAHVLMIHNVDPEWMYKINGVLWSIGIEAQLYLVFPLLVLLLWKVGRLGTILLAGLVSWALLVSLPNGEKLYPWYLGLFALGMAASHLAHRPPKWRGPSSVAGALLAVVALVACLWATQVRTQMVWRDSFIGLSVASLMYAGVVSPRAWYARLLGVWPLAALGAISYSLYLMHHPILQPLYLFRPPWARGAELEMRYLLTIGLPVILIGCAAFWFVFERPYLRSRRAADSDRKQATGHVAERARA